MLEEVGTSGEVIFEGRCEVESQDKLLVGHESDGQFAFRVFSQQNEEQDAVDTIYLSRSAAAQLVCALTLALAGEEQ